MRLLALCLLLVGCEKFDSIQLNADNIAIDRACKAQGLETDVSVGGNFLCRPKAGAATK